MLSDSDHTQYFCSIEVFKSFNYSFTQSALCIIYRYTVSDLIYYNLILCTHVAEEATVVFLSIINKVQGKEETNKHWLINNTLDLTFLLKLLTCFCKHPNGRPIAYGDSSY